jgi:AraC family transcriptional regulator
LAKIALALQRALEVRRTSGEPGRAAAHTIARGETWRVADVVCTSGPQDRPFEERHSQYSIAIVVAGTFQYRSETGAALMTPGSLMLGSPALCFECGHEHAEGDRCVSFWYSTEYFERLVSDAGHRGRVRFAIPRVPPLRALAPVVAAAASGLLDPDCAPWDEIGVELAACAAGLARGARPPYRSPRNAEARVTRTVRAIDRCPAAPATLDAMARDAGLSPYHFLRTFERVTGITPHQYVLRARLRDAALRLTAPGDRILDVALEAGFGDVSNFNRTFRAEFGASPREYRLRRLAG